MKYLKQLLNLWPPMWGAGIRVKHISPDYTYLEVELKLRFWNRNYVGTHYGGSLYSMTDPFYMLMLIQILGPHYIVWDKAASIRFVKPGKGTVRAFFRLTEAQIQSIKDEIELVGKVEPVLNVDIVDNNNDIVASVEKTLHIRKKKTTT